MNIKLDDPKTVAMQDKIITETVEEILKRTAPSVLDRYFERLGMTEEAIGQVAFLAAKTGDDRETVLRKALTLYGLAVDAVDKGNKVAILSPEDEVIQDIVGFGVSSGTKQAAKADTGR